MHENIIILGPTSTGKTDLANFMATNRSLSVFNCDSVQIYRDLNVLTNKPEFYSQEVLDDEIVSFTKPAQFLDFNKYKDFTFKVYIHNSSGLTIKSCEDGKELQKLLMSEEILIDKVSNAQSVSNYLFDIREPRKDYSVQEFLKDIGRISKKSKLNERIIVGGTIYYAFNYIFNSSEDSSKDLNIQLSDLKDRLKNSSAKSLLEFLQKKDPDLLNTVDRSNKSRLINAVAYIKSTDKKYSDVYFKEEQLLDDFVLIMIYPKSREEYCKKLDNIVEKRMNITALDEIKSLVDTYGEDIEPWLQKISYEYRYGLEIYKSLENKGFNNLDIKKYKEILEILKAKERQYTKRQVTFMRKLEKKLLEKERI
jgi:tRNA dimethylallyltransferase